jgi:thymidylate synthase
MISGRKYWPIFQASKDNPQLEPVLKEQLTLREKRAELLKQIKATADEKKKKELTGELEKVVGQQFDLIVKRKQLGCEDLAKKLEELKKEVNQKKAEIEQWKGKDFKNGQVKKRVNELLNETERFEWEN